METILALLKGWLNAVLEAVWTRRQRIFRFLWECVKWVFMWSFTSFIVGVIFGFGHQATNDYFGAWTARDYRDWDILGTYAHNARANEPSGQLVIFSIIGLLMVSVWTHQIVFKRFKKYRILNIIPVAIVLEISYLVILLYSTECRIYGISHSGSTVFDPESCLYFSMTTWTTVGYGDFVPTPQFRLLAATEPLLGYVFLGVLLATIIRLLSSPKLDG